jgi:hypothetical protein
MNPTMSAAVRRMLLRRKLQDKPKLPYAAVIRTPEINSTKGSLQEMGEPQKAHFPPKKIYPKMGIR